MVLAALVAGAVLAVDPLGIAPFGPAKWALIPTLVLLALASSRTTNVPRNIALAWGVFLLLVAGSAAAGLDPIYAWIGTPERRFGALTWLLCAVAFAAGTGERRRGLVTGAAAVATGVTGVWVLAELAGLEPIDVVGAGNRPIGPLGSSAYLGAAMCLLVPATIAHRTRWAYGAAALGAVALVASGARAAWLGAVVAAIAWAALHPQHRRRVAVVAAALVVAALAGGRLTDVVTDDRGGVAGRLDEWRIALNVIADHPLTGTGPEGYRIAFGRAVDDAYEIEHGRDPLPDRAHSALLDVAATTGIPGVAAHLALLAVVAPAVVAALRRQDLVAAGVLAYAAQSLALFPLAELDPIAWALAGTTLAETARARRRRVPVRVAAAAGAAIALVTGITGVIADRGDGDADLRPDVLRYHLIDAERHRARGDLDAALESLERARDVSPRDPVVRSERADILLDLDPVAARRALETLAEDDPRNAEVLLRLGVARARTGDLDGARAAWRRAERLAPDSTAATENLRRLDAREEQGT